MQRSVDRTKTSALTHEMPFKIGVSACLMGHSVRYNGEHKYRPDLILTLERHFQCIALCPELAIGLGVPRPPIQLSRINNEVQAINVHAPERSYTKRLKDYASQVTLQYDLKGFVLKAKSPSCGIRDIPIFDSQNTIVEFGHGIFSQRFMRLRPGLPVADEVQLTNGDHMISFVDAVYKYSNKTPSACE